MDYKWKPITELSDSERNYDLAYMGSLRDVWQDAMGRLSATSSDNLKIFHEKLARQWSIETGILERLYDIDMGITMTLIDRGFTVDYVERSGTNRDPEQLIAILRDHRAAVELVQQCVTNSRRLTVGLINELHAILTRHQDTVEAVDQFGNISTLPLRKGAFKVLPNNPKREDGSMHEYCPPVHVAQEMDNLISWYNEYAGSQLNPILVAAWFHHRFTQIHPYQDGNGRVVRALANLTLIKSHFLPLVVTRDHRWQYIKALESADAGKLGLLVKLFAEIEKRTILQALSIAPDTKPTMAIVEEIADSIALKLRKRKEEAIQKLRRVNEVALSLQSSVETHLRELTENVKARLDASADFELATPQIIKGGPGQLYKDKATEHWYHYQVVTSAQESKQRVNFNESHYFVRARLSADDEPWLTYVVSFHHIGEELSGVMEITAFGELSYTTADEEKKSGDIYCMDMPFTITYTDNPESVLARLLEWVDETFAIAVKQWGDAL